MIRLTGMNSGLDTDAMVRELVNAYEKKGQKTKNDKTKFEWKQSIWTDLNKKIRSFNSKIKSMQYTTNYNQKKTVSSNENKVSVVAGENAVKGTQRIKVKALASTGYLTGADVNLDEAGNKVRSITRNSTLEELGITSSDGKVSITVNGKETVIDANKDTTIDKFVTALNAKGVGVDASFDEKNGRFFISAETSGEAGDFMLKSLEKNEDGEYIESDNVLSKLGLIGDKAKKLIGSDAEIELNGATFTSSSNSFDINGMAISVKGLTAQGPNGDGSDDEEITLTTDVDTDTIYKNIKGLINEYSKLMNELSKLYNAPTAKKFDPLTDEEKDAMTDDEVEKWETRIKDSLLRRDTNVAATMNAMKNSTANAYTVNGKKLTLLDFGIETLSYFEANDNEKSALHINGDEDDEAVSGKTNKLKQMIASDPDTVASFFSKLMTDMSDKFNTLSRTTTNRSYGNFYDDKKVKSEMSSYEKKVSDFETYLADIEDKYYKQFTRMEKAMAKLNSTQTQLGNYFG